MRERLPPLEAMEAELLRRSTSAAVTHDRESVRERCKTLSGFIREAWHVVLPGTPYVHNWHIDLLSRHLEAVTDGELLALGYENRLLINVPPGMMKSLLVCVFWLAWEWGPKGMGHLQALSTSYALEFCKRDSLRFRNLVGSEWYRSLWPEIELTSQSDDLVANTLRGERKTVAFGSLTGGRADRLYIDDPHSVKTAESDAQRATTEILFRDRAIFSTNDSVRSAIAMVMQRLHQRDLSGIVLESKMPWLHVMLPMRFEPDRKCVTPFGSDIRTDDGELLFPERFPRSAVDRDEGLMTISSVAGQMQQRPVPRGGLIFKRDNFEIVPAVPGGPCRTVRGWDLAASEERNAAYTCGVKVTYHNATRQFYVEDVVRLRIENIEPTLLRVARKDNENGRRVEISIPQDPGQAAKVQVKYLTSALVGFNVHHSTESGDKIARAEPVVAQSEAGNVKIVKGPWNDAFLDEIEMFPLGQFKDQVDALSRAFARFVMSPAEYVTAPIVVTQLKTVFGDHPGG